MSSCNRLITLTFALCRMFVDEDDEFCMRNRGTEYIKSPEMLTLTLNSKKEADNFDRRKKVAHQY